MTATMPLVPLGQVVATPGAIAALAAARVHPIALLRRHAAGDWGTLDLEDWAANDRAMTEGERLLSCYLLPTPSALKLWIITEADRSVTTLLLPEEY